LPEESINEELRQHAVDIVSWQHTEQARLFHHWAERFNQVFDLGLRKPALRIEGISGQRLGTYRQGRNGFGVLDEITINARHLYRPLADHLATLLHEMIHEWQYLYGKPGRRNYHNRQFQQKARLYGLIVDERGHHLGVEPGRFTSLLTQHGVDVSDLRAPDKEAPLLSKKMHRGDSKLKKWSCGCTNVRCAVQLAARCLRCGNVFQEAAPAW